jgi:hypothetical protein
MRVVDDITHASVRASILGVPQLYVEGSHYGSIEWKGNELMDMRIVGKVSDLPDLTDDAVFDEDRPEAYLAKRETPFPWALLGGILWLALWTTLIVALR